MLRFKEWTLYFLVVVLTFVAFEACFRVASDVPVFQDTNFRNRRVIEVLMSNASAYDPVLGWTLVSHYSSAAHGGDASLNTIEYGIRKNGPETQLRKRSILVVGGSFAAGSEVPDWHTWPAALERLTGKPVLNAAVGAFSVDQAVLRAEQLLPLLQPTILIVEAMDYSIVWNSYSSRPRPKPYFTIEEGRLVHHNSPVPTFTRSKYETTRIKDVLGHSLVIDHIMAKFLPDAWYASGQNVTTRIQSDEVEVSCRLLTRLKKLAETHDTRLLLLAHVQGQDLIGRNVPPSNLQLVNECAQAAGIQVADTFSTFKALETREPGGLRKFFSMHGDIYGHMSAEGNLEVAKVLSDALVTPFENVSARWDTNRSAKAVSVRSEQPQNLIPDSESLALLLPPNSLCKTEELPSDTSGSTRLRISASGSKTEHYIGTTPVEVSAGPLTFSFEVRPEKMPAIKAQLFQGENGAIGEIDLERNATSTVRFGKARNLSAGIEPIADGWFRVRVTGTFPGGSTRMLIQLLGPDGHSQFDPNGGAIVVRRVQLEHGERASTYQATSTIHQ